MRSIGCSNVQQPAADGSAFFSRLSHDFRTIAVDDSAFSRAQKKVACAGVVCRGAVVEGVFSFSVTRDGFDSTQKILAAISASRLAQGTKLVLLNGIALAGLNLVDIGALSQELGAAVIAVTANKPRAGEMRKAIEAVAGAGKKIVLLEKAGRMRGFVVGGKRFYAQFAGCPPGQARALLSSFGGFPEPLRLAHLVAGAVGKMR